VQADTLSTDLAATQRAYAAIDADASRLVDAEVTAVAAYRPALVFADIPALAFDVAAELGVPGVAMTNFSWDWIYADYASELPAFAALVGSLRASYARATLLLRLPLHGDLGAFRASATFRSWRGARRCRRERCARVWTCRAVTAWCCCPSAASASRSSVRRRCAASASSAPAARPPAVRGRAAAGR
jgi:L-arabinokinase